MITNLIDRWMSFAHSKFNEVGATATSGAMVVDGFDDSWTLADWSTVLGMIYIATMLIPRFIEFGRWVVKKWESKNVKPKPKRKAKS